jgi:hypothetical protein
MVHVTSDFDVNTIKLSCKQPFSRRNWGHIAVTYDGTARAAGLQPPMPTAAPIQRNNGRFLDSDSILANFCIGRNRCLLILQEL